MCYLPALEDCALLDPFEAAVDISACVDLITAAVVPEGIKCDGGYTRRQPELYRSLTLVFSRTLDESGDDLVDPRFVFVDEERGQVLVEDLAELDEKVLLPVDNQ